MEHEVEIPEKIEKEQICFGSDAVLNNAHAIHIGYGMDENFAMPTGVSIFSVLKNNAAESIVFHILTEKISDESQQKFREIADEFPNCMIVIHILDVQILDGLPVFSSLGKAAYFRILLESVLPDSICSVLYLDGDVLCLNAIRSLLDKSFDGNTIMAVKDVPATAKTQEAKFRVHDYFNSGVLYINLVQWRREKVTEAFLNVFYRQKDELNHLDQDALNIVLNDQKLILEQRFNYISDRIETQDVPPQTIFLHYAGTKPWYFWLDFPLQKYFKNYYRISPWRNQPLNEPRNYREMHYMSRAYWRKKKYAQSLKWLVRYLITKAKA